MRLTRNLKMIFQQPRSSFDPRLSIGASIGETLKVAGMARKERYGEIERLLRMVGLDASYAKAKPMELSGGECQRAAIARAIAAKPRLLICDECTSALDVSVQAQIMDLLRQLRRHWRGRPERMKTHSPSLVFAVIGQARADGAMTPEQEHELLSKMLRGWALRRSVNQ